MTEILMWAMVLGLAAAIAGIYLLSMQIENQSRETTRMMHQNNEMILAQLERLAGTAVAVSDTVGIILEKRSAERRSRTVPMTEDPAKA